MTKEREPVKLGETIRSYRLQSEMTQDDLAKELHITRQTLSNWERNINQPDFDALEHLCTIFGIQLDTLAKEAIHMNETTGKQAAANPMSNPWFNRYHTAIGLFYAVGLFLGMTLFFVGGLIVQTINGWAVSFFLGLGCFLVFGLSSHAIITLVRKDWQ